jgi:integrase
MSKSKPKAKRGHGAGSLYVRELASGPTYYGRWRMPDGKRHNAVIGPVRTAGYADGLTKTMAEAKLRELIAATPTPSSRPSPRRGRSFQSTADAWTAQLEARKRAPTYIEDARSALKWHVLPFFGADTDITTIDVDRCEAFVGHLSAVTSTRTGRNLSAKTITNYARILTALLAFATQRRWIAANPAIGLVLPGATDDDGDVIEPDQVLWPDDVAKLVAAVPAGPYEAIDRALYVVATMAGVRKGELLGETWDHVDFDARRLRVFEQLARGDLRRRPKSRKGRSVPMSDDVMTALLELRNASRWTRPTDPVFADPVTGRRIAWTPARRRYRAALTAAGLPPRRFHDLRHTFASVLARDGVNERHIQEWCGHSSPTVTRRYMHFAPAAAQDIDAVNRAFGRVTNRVTNLRAASVPAGTSEKVASAL